MIESSYLSTEQLLRGRRVRRNMLWGALLVTLFLVFASMGGLAHLFPQAPATAVCAIGATVLLCLVAPALVWNNPRLGVYIIFAGTILFPALVVGRVPTVPTSYVPLWWNISTVGQVYANTEALNPLIFSPAEILIVLTALSWLIRSVVSREFRLELGTFFWPILAYSAVVTAGFFHGIGNGGNVTMALYEVRSQAHFLLAYLMAANMFTERKHVVILLWLSVACIGLQGVFGTITYFVERGHISDQGILSHDDSLVVNVLFYLLFLLVLTRANARLAWVALLLTPTAVITMLANNRRAGIAAFAIAFLMTLPVMWTAFPELRRKIAALIACFAVLGAIYLPLAWNAAGTWAFPARAFRSQFDPDVRDQASDIYRVNEDFDLKYTLDQEPIFGIGYGKPFIQKIVLPQVTTDFLQYMPHDSVLWVWMRLGHLGFCCFLMMFASILITGTQSVKATRDPQLKIVGLLAVAFTLMLYVYGKYDLQFVNTRQMVMAAIFIGSLSILRKLDAAQAGEGEGDGSAQSNADA